MGEEDMENPDELHDLAMDVFLYLVGKGTDATRLTDTNPPVIMVRKNTGETFRITVEPSDWRKHV
jgi:hypothetical protein